MTDAPAGLAGPAQSAPSDQSPTDQTRPVPQAAPVTLRIATFNIQDVRGEQLHNGSDEKLRAIASVIQQLRPNIILLNEIAYDAPTFNADGTRLKANNAQRFIDHYLHVPQGANTAHEPADSLVRYRPFMAPVNTGMPSGLDLNNDGRIVAQPPTRVEGDQRRNPEVDAYAQDCWGYGTFPGQYGMALLVDERLAIESTQIRTFRLLPWDYMPGALLPLAQKKPDGSTSPWFNAEELKVARLSSKSHWDVPVKLPNGVTLHLLCSHPTPPVFDGEEKRNARRNHDEIRFWPDYIVSEPYIVDDANEPGGLPDGASFVILGDLNADPDEGQSINDPIGRTLGGCARINLKVVPKSDVVIDGLDPDDTAMFKMRVDYVLPSTDLAILEAGVWRRTPAGVESFPSDHFPVWMDLRVDP